MTPMGSGAFIADIPAVQCGLTVEYGLDIDIRGAERPEYRGRVVDEALKVRIPLMSCTSAATPPLERLRPALLWQMCLVPSEAERQYRSRR